LFGNSASFGRLRVWLNRGIRLSGGRSDLKGENAVSQRATKEAQSATKLQSHRDSLPVRVCNPYTNSAVLIKISIFNTHPLGPGKKCGKWVLKTAKRGYIFRARVSIPGKKLFHKEPPRRHIKATELQTWVRICKHKFFSLKRYASLAVGDKC
jgi:hypothetical protein